MKSGFLILFLLGQFVVIGQGIELPGIVTDIATNLPLVTDLQLQGKSTSFNSKSESTGLFKFSNIPPGNYKLIVKLTGYKDYEKDLNLNDAVATARDHSFVLIQMIDVNSKVRAQQLDYTEFDKIYASIGTSKDVIASTGELLKITDRLFTPEDEEYFTAYNLAGSYYSSAGMVREAIICFTKAIEAYEKYFPFNTRHVYPTVQKQWADYIYYQLGSLYSTAKLYESCVNYFESRRKFFEQHQSAVLRYSFFQSLAYAYIGIGDTDRAIASAEELMQFLKSGQQIYEPTPLLEYKPSPTDSEDVKKSVQATYDQANARIQKNNARNVLLSRYMLLYSYHNILSAAYQHKYDFENLAKQQHEGRKAYSDMMKVINETISESEAETKASGLVLPDSVQHQQALSKKYSALANANTSFWPILAFVKTGKPEEARQYINGNLDRGLYFMLNGNYGEAEKSLALYWSQVEEFKDEKLFGNFINMLRNNFLQYHIRLNALQGKYTDAVTGLRELLLDYEKKFKSGFAYLTEAEKKELFRDYTKQLDFYYSVLLSAAEKDPAHGFEMLNKVLQTKGIILEYTRRQNEKIKNLKDSETRALITRIKALRVKQTSFNELKLKEPGGKWADSLIANGRKINDLEQKINNKLGSGDDFFSNYSWKDIQRKMKPGEAYLDIVRVVRDNFRFDRPKVQYWAFVIKSGNSNPEFFMISEGDAFETRNLRFYQNNIRSILEDTQSYDTYWKPVETAIAGVQKILMAPDGVYHLINPLTLKNPSTQQYLVDELEILRLSSGRDLFGTVRNNAPLKTVTLVGNPDFRMSRKTGITREMPVIQSDELASASPSRYGIVALPGTEKEVNLIRDRVAGQGYKTIAYYGRDASESNVKKIKSPSVLHFATHGLFDNIQDKSDSYLKSKLVLAGADDGESFSIVDYQLYEDGFLTGYEVTQMNLTETQLVVLSACETGLGDLQGGEGVWGLQRAFQMAGASSVMGSLWKINDETTVHFMDVFYKTLLTGASFQQAYKNAMLSARQKFEHPYYWGAFLLL